VFPLRFAGSKPGKINLILLYLIEHNLLTHSRPICILRPPLDAVHDLKVADVNQRHPLQKNQTG
jgi:hypothetical protein